MTPLLPLDFWRQEIGYNPWHFWGLADSTIVPVTSSCNDIVKEYAWQGTDEAGREDIRTAVEAAEKLLFNNLQFWPAPQYSSVTLPWPRYIDQRLSRLSRMDARGNWVPVQLQEGFIKNVGVETRSLIKAGSALVYTDLDGDGLKETFTITEATSITDVSEIAIYFAAADRLTDDNALGERWRIEPLTITISGGTMTAKGKRWLVAKPTLYQSKANYPIDPTVDTNFITTADVYRRYCSQTGTNSILDSQAALIWETRPCSWGCGNTITNNSTDPASEGWVAARCGIRNAEIGIVTPAEAVYNASSGTWSHPGECFSSCSEPDRVLIRYLAGADLDYQGHMVRNMRKMVARLATAEMTRRICACDKANREWSNWQFDISRQDGPETYIASPEALNNPLGTRRGHVFAWQQIKSLSRIVGMIA